MKGNKMKVYRVTWNRDFLAKSEKEAYNQVYDELFTYTNMGKSVKPLPWLMKLKEEEQDEME